TAGQKSRPNKKRGGQMSAAGSGKRPADNCSRKQPIRFRKTYGGGTGGDAKPRSERHSEYGIDIHQSKTEFAR
ncbi:hypothetical protein, partial [Alistipes finegoldii]|uniref:hypothetical protein n=1 Tax=Alistipes finegoldii TaxID=214856 RepID=UPI00242DDF57